MCLQVCLMSSSSFPSDMVLEVLDSSQVGWRLFKVGCVGGFVGDASLEELYCVHKQGCLPYYRPDRTIHGCNKPSRLGTPQHLYLWSTLKFFIVILNLLLLFYNCTSPFAICTESRAGEIGNFPAGQQLKIEATVL